MLKQIVMVLVTAVVATFITLNFSGTDQGSDQAVLEQLTADFKRIDTTLASKESVVLHFTEELGQDAWLRGAARDGSPRPGPADDAKPLTDASNSICFLTKVEFTGMDGAEDTTSCRVSVDDFTGWWQVRAIQGDGTDSSVSCNARCLVWDTE